MPFWTGINGKAKQILAPFVGVGGKARRVVKGYIGVGNKAKLFYDYLDHIDHVEIDYTGFALWTTNSQAGGTKVAEGKSATIAKGGILTLSGGVVTVGIQNCPKEYCVYFYWKAYLVLKDGNKISLAFPHTNDSKTATYPITVNNLSYTGSRYYYPWVYLDNDLWNDGPPFTKTAQYTSDACFIRQHAYSDNNKTSYVYTFGNVTFNGVTYTTTFGDMIPA